MHESDGRQYDKNGLEYFACHCGDLSNIRETGNGRGSIDDTSGYWLQFDVRE